MVLNYWAGAGTFSQQRIAADIYDSENQGTYSSELVLYPRGLGFMSHSFQGDLPALKEVVGTGHPGDRPDETHPAARKGPLQGR